MRPRDPDLAQAEEVARTLTGMPADIEHLLGGGRNSRIYHVRCGTGEFALKQYPLRTDDPRDRLSTEVDALKLMERYSVDTVPRVVGFDRKRGFALLSWIDGSAVTDIGDADIDAATAFLAAIHALRNTPWANEQPLAAEACLSGVEIERQVTERVTRLQRVPEERDLLCFLEKSFAPAFTREVANAKLKIQAAGLDFAGELPQECRSLVPSDFGFHNSLRRSDGSLAFVDFEYFGWDDPVKLTADILLHPGRILAPPQRKRLRQGAVRLYGEDAAFARRLSAYIPLFGLRWVLILLNEFIPERWHRRVLAGDARSWNDAKARQLADAQAFLASLSQKVED